MNTNQKLFLWIASAIIILVGLMFESYLHPHRGHPNEMDHFLLVFLVVVAITTIVWNSKKEK